MYKILLTILNDFRYIKKWREINNSSIQFYSMHVAFH